MFSDGRGNIPTLSTGEVPAGLQSGILEEAQTAAAPALALRALIIQPVFQTGYSLWISEYPYARPTTAEVTQIWGNSFSYLTNSASPIEGTTKPNTVIADTKKEIKIEMAERLLRTRERLVLADRHYLKRGALVLANQYGGIDPGQLDQTSQSLIARLLVARKAGLHTTNEYVEAGLLDPLINQCMGDVFLTYIDDTSMTLNSYDLLNNEDRVGSGPKFIDFALLKSRKFIEENSEELIELAHSQANS